MIADPSPQERRHIRMMCESLRRVLVAEKPAGFMAILQEVGNIECNALIATDDELQSVRRSLDELLQSLMGQGIINPRNWSKFFGD